MEYRLKRSEVMEDLLKAGAIRPECVEQFKRDIEDVRRTESAQ